MAFITESGGPYGFSLNESFAYESYSSSEGRTRAAPPCGCCVAGANRSIDGLRPITPTAVATPPTNLRRETVFRSSTIASQWKSPPSSIFHLPSSIFHLPSSIFHRRYVQLRSCFDNGNDRILFPVAAKIALHSAGITGGSAGSPSPVGGLSVLRKDTSTGHDCRMRSSGKVWRFVLTVRPLSIVISCPNAWAMPSSAAPWHWFSAWIGLMIWLPMSPTTQTLSTFSAPAFETVACTTSAK